MLSIVYIYGSINEPFPGERAGGGGGGGGGGRLDGFVKPIEPCQTARSA